MEIYPVHLNEKNKQRKQVEKIQRTGEHNENTSLSLGCCCFVFLLPLISYENVLLIAAVINSNEF